MQYDGTIPPFFFACGLTRAFFVITKGVLMYKITYMGDGTTTEFNFNFPFYENDNIIVKKNNTIASNYTIVGTQGGLNADIPYTSGKVVFDIAPVSTDVITISRKIALKRYVDYQPTEKINPTILNQDQNYTIEIIKDFDGKFEEIDEKYSEIIDTESTQTLIEKMDRVSEQIENMGDISTLRDDVDDLKTTTQTQSQTITNHTTNLDTLNTRTNGMIDYVVESQAPTSSNNYTWYRKYKSGWVEQGGHSVGSLNGEKVINLPITMSNKRYHFSATMSLSDNDSSPQTVLSVRRQRNSINDTTSSVAVLATYTISGTNGYTGWDFDWEVKGFAA